MFSTMTLRFSHIVESKKKSNDDDKVEEKSEEKKEEKKVEKIIIVDIHDERLKEIVEDSIVHVVKEEIDAVIRMIFKRLPYADDEEAKEESHLSSIQTVQGGKLREETPEELCYADCLTRGVVHGFGMHGVLISSLWVLKLTVAPKLSNTTIFGVTGALSYLTNGVLTLRCFLSCHQLKRIRR